MPNECDRNSMPKNATNSAAATRWNDSIAGCHGWLMIANGSSVTRTYFM